MSIFSEKPYLDTISSVLLNDLGDIPSAHGVIGIALLEDFHVLESFARPENYSRVNDVSSLLPLRRTEYDDVAGPSSFLRDVDVGAFSREGSFIVLRRTIPAFKRFEVGIWSRGRVAGRANIS